MEFVELERIELNREAGWGLTGVGMLLMLAAAIGFGALAEALGADVSWPSHNWLAWVLAVLVGVPLHELLHGLPAALVGARPRYGVGRAGILPYVYCATPDHTYTRNQYLLCAITPLVVLDLVAVALLLVPGWAPVAFAVLVTNTGGAVGDLWYVSRLLRYPAAIRAVDKPNGAVLMGPEARSSAPGLGA